MGGVGVGVGEIPPPKMNVSWICETCCCIEFGEGETWCAFSLVFLLVVDLNNDLVLDTSLIHGGCKMPVPQNGVIVFGKGPAWNFPVAFFGWGP